MTERFRNPVIKYTTDTLKTLPGSKLYFTQNGTSTPKTVYADKNKVTSLGSVVTADSAGIFVPIFLDGTYRVELKSAAGVTQTGWPVDNVGGEDTAGAFDDWSAITSYSIGEIVTGSNGLRYVSTVNSNLNNDPTITANIPTYWTEYRVSTAWNAASVYALYDRVQYTDGAIYISLQASNINHTPSSNSAWWKKTKDMEFWNNATTYSSGVYVYEGELRYKSMQGSNTNHQPSTDTSYTWWKPESRIDLETNAQLVQVKYLSGGGNLFPEWDNWLTDSSSYSIPAANTVPANTQLVVTKPDKYRTNTPTITPSGGDYFEWSGANDFAGIQLLTSRIEVLKFVSNGSNGWRIG